MFCSPGLISFTIAKYQKQHQLAGHPQVKQELKIEIENSPKKQELTFLVREDSALVKGNLGQSELKKIGPNFFVEKTNSGNIFLWSVIPKANTYPTVIFQMKGYELAGPYSITVAWLCK